MRAFASTARHGTKGERVALVSGASKGDDPSSVSLAETSSRAARASILLGALAALAALAVVAVVGVTSTSSLGSLLAPAALGQSGVPDDEIPEGIGYTGVGGQSTTTACAMAALRPTFWCSCTDSAIWRPTVITGLSEVMGS